MLLAARSTSLWDSWIPFVCGYRFCDRFKKCPLEFRVNGRAIVRCLVFGTQKSVVAQHYPNKGQGAEIRKRGCLKTVNAVKLRFSEKTTRPDSCVLREKRESVESRASQLVKKGPSSRAWCRRRSVLCTRHVVWRKC